MNLRMWSSNSSEFMKQIENTCDDEVVKVLGLDWNTKRDTLQLRFTCTTKATTKRDVLKIIASVYDPCSYAAPHLLSAKLFLQELWKTKAKWDSPLSQEMSKKWSQSICRDLEKIKDLSIPRWYTPTSSGNKYKLHCFCDASLRAYAAATYIVQGTDKNFVIGKSRLAPIKDQDNLKIPRLELLAVLLGTRLIKFILKHLKTEFTQLILWTDSQIVIEWINSDKLLPPFVSRRIEEIKQIKDLEIKHVPSEENPADVATKPTKSYEERTKWINGPEFLIKDTKMWPSEVKKNNSDSLLAAEGLLTKKNDSKTKELRLEKTQTERNIQPRSLQTNVTLDKTEEIKQLQAQHFPLETKGKETDLSRNLQLFRDTDGILRCKGRFGNADWSFDKRYPILIPKDCDFTNKVVMKTHEENYHVGANHTLSLIRNIYWIPHGKSQVQKYLRKCLKCQKHGGGPFKAPPTPALPPERVNYSSAFNFVGIDLMGPMYINNGKGNEKRWICLYTCLAIRAVQLEVVQNLTAEEGLLALRRMIATRGVPALITSDNALYFKLMAEILSNKYCIDNQIRWRFIPQLAPWFGGFYERLVGIVKNCMKRTLEKHMLNDVQLVTTVKEIEAVINTRPLTCVDSEIDHILRPSDFLTMGKCITVQPSQENLIENGTITKTELIKGWKRTLTILQEFREMFVNRYLPSLRERYQHSHKEPRITSKIEPEVGQIVQIKGESKNREEWRVGKIISLIKGHDNLCRVAKVKVGDKEFIRSITHLYPLELDEEEERQHRSETSLKGTYHPSQRETGTITIYPNLGNEESISETALESERNVLPNTDIENMETLVESKFEGERVEEGEYTPRKEVEKEIENIEKDMDENSCVNNETKQKRKAAIKALSKIKEWTRDLIMLLY